MSSEHFSTVALASFSSELLLLCIRVFTACRAVLAPAATHKLIEALCLRPVGGVSAAAPATKPPAPELLHPLLGMSCLRLLPSTSTPLATALAFGLLAPPSLNVPPPPRSVAGSPEHAQSVMQALAAQLSAGIAGAAAWGHGGGAFRGTNDQSRDDLAQAFEASLAAAGDEVDGESALELARLMFAACPVLCIKAAKQPT